MGPSTDHPSIHPVVKRFTLNEQLQGLQERLDQSCSAYTTNDLAEFVERVQTLVKQLDRSSCSKHVVVLLGMPGVGKTTQCGLVVEALAAPRYHLGRFSRTVELSPEERARVNAQRESGSLIDGLSERFLQSVAESENSTVIIDGFPRRPHDAVTLLEYAKKYSWKLTIISMCFERGGEIEASFDRQLKRHYEREEQVPPAGELNRFVNKLVRMVEHSAPAIQVLEQAGCEVHSIIVGGRTVEDIQAEISGALGKSEQLLPIPCSDTVLLDRIEKARQVAGVSKAFVACGAFYRPFFNDRFGPPSEPVDIHVGVMEQQEAERLREVLQRECSGLRFKVQPLPKLMETLYAAELADKSILDILRASPFVWLQGALCLEHGESHVVGTPQCLSDLKEGILRLDEDVLKSLSSECRQAVIAKGCQRAHQLVSAYHGLRLVGVLEQAYRETFQRYVPIPYCADPKHVEEQVLAHESEHGGLTHWKTGILPIERNAADKAVDFIKGLSQKVRPVPIPPSVELPGLLGELQRKKESYKNSYVFHKGNADDSHKRIYLPPQNYNSWLHYMSEEASDAQWREWILNQWKSGTPLAGRDPWLKAILNLDVEEALRDAGIAHVNNLEGAQKQTHRGVCLSLHLLWAALSLETQPTVDAMPVVGHSLCSARKVRSGMRLAALAHDLGKLANEAAVYTPGVHGILGQRIWDVVRPTWVDETANRVARWCIGNHDLLGRLARGLTEKISSISINGELEGEQGVNQMPSYRGAYDPSSIREVLAELQLPREVALLVCRDIWKADVAAVPGLRWLIPAAEYLSAIVEAGDPTRES